MDTGTDKRQQRKPVAKHWYFITYRECVLCGSSELTRERRYDEKPADPEKRHDFSQYACGEHFI